MFARPPCILAELKTFGMGGGPDLCAGANAISQQIALGLQLIKSKIQESLEPYQSLLYPCDLPMMRSLLPSNTEKKKSLNFSRKFKTAKSHAMFLSTSNKMKEKNHPIWNHYKLACSGKYWKALQQVIMTRATVIHVYKVSLVSVGCLCRITRNYLQYLPQHGNRF